MIDVGPKTGTGGQREHPVPEDLFKAIERMLAEKGPHCIWCGVLLQEGKLCQKCKQRIGGEP